MTLSKEQEAALLAAQQARTKAKTAVTRRVTRIANGVSYEYTQESMNNLLVDLEDTYSDFLDKADVYEEMCTDLNAPSSFLVIGGHDLNNYKIIVKEKFMEGRNACNSYVNNLSSASSARSQQSSTPPAQSNLVYLKKQDPPRFTGFFKDFPEWDSLFEKMVVPNVPNKTALAYLLFK